MSARKTQAPKTWSARGLQLQWAVWDESDRFEEFNDAYNEILDYLLVFSNRLWNRYGFIANPDDRLKERIYVMQGYEWVLREMEEAFGRYMNPKWPNEDWYCGNWEHLGGWKAPRKDAQGREIVDPSFINFVDRYVKPWANLGLTDDQKNQYHSPA